MVKRLSPDDWIAAGFRALATGGPQAIRAEAIARDLKVSKGSFYWHFADVPAFKSAMLEFWSQAATQDIIDLVGHKEGTAAQRLHLLINVATSRDISVYGGPKVEAAIRDWARYDDKVDVAIHAIDEQRIEFVRVQFQSHGHNDEVSITYANILYGALIGLNNLTAQKMVNRQENMVDLLGLLLK